MSYLSTQCENSEHLASEKKYEKENQHICLLCDTGYQTKISLLGRVCERMNCEESKSIVYICRSIFAKNRDFI
jgi:hypothetical protein